MSQHPVHARGGPAACQRVAVAAGGITAVLLQDEEQTQRGRSSWINIRNAGANNLFVFFTEQAATVGTNFRTVVPGGELELPAEARPNPLPAASTSQINQNPGHLWFDAAVGGTTVEIVTVFRA